MRANKPQRFLSKENSIRQLREVSLTKNTIDAVRTHLPDDIYSVIVPFVRFNQPQFDKYTANITPKMARLFQKYCLHDGNIYLHDLLKTIPVDKLEKYVRRGSAKIYYKKCYGTSIYLRNKEKLDEWDKSFSYRWDLSYFMRDLHESITTDQCEYSDSFPTFSVEERARMLENLLLSFIFVHRKYSTVPLADYF